MNAGNLFGAIGKRECDFRTHVHTQFSSSLNVRVYPKHIVSIYSPIHSVHIPISRSPPFPFWLCSFVLHTYGECRILFICSIQITTWLHLR